jgi:hypothetical protein
MFFVGCDAFDNEQTATIDAIGVWEWAYSEGGWSPRTYADSVDYSGELIIRSHEAFLYTDEEFTYKYQMKERKHLGNGYFYMELVVGKGCDAFVKYHKETEILEMAPANCFDAPSLFFKRPSD